MIAADNSAVMRELEWCKQSSLELKKQAEHGDLTENSRAALAALELALSGAAEAYDAVSAYIKDGASGTGGNPRKMRRMIKLQAQLLTKVAERGRLQMTMANNPVRAQESKAIFDRIAEGETILNALHDSLPA